MTKYLSVAAFARRCGVTRSAVYLWIEDGLVPARKIDGVIRIPAAAKRPKLALGRPHGTCVKDSVLA